MTVTVTHQENPRMGRIRLLTSVMIGITALFCVFWLSNIFGWFIPFVFGENTPAHPWARPDGELTWQQKYIFVGLWVILIKYALDCFWAAIGLLWALRAGRFFTVDTCRRIQVLGRLLVITMIAETAVSALAPPILTWYNQPDVGVGFLPASYYFDSGDIALLLCGLGFFVIGWVLAEGARIAEENKAFV